MLKKLRLDNRKQNILDPPTGFQLFLTDKYLGGKMIPDGTQEQQFIGNLLAHIRADRLVLTQKMLAKRLSEVSPEYIAPTRISDVERGKVNLTKSMVDIYMLYLQSDTKFNPILDEITNNEDYQAAYLELPDNGIMHRPNIPGNPDKTTQSTPIASVKKGKPTKLANGMIEVTLVDGILTVTDSQGHSMSTNRISLKITL